MSALVVDTSSWITYFDRRDAGGAAIEEAAAEGRLHLSPIVAAEILSGTLTPRRRAELESTLAELPLCVSDLGHWFRVGQLRMALRKKGLHVTIPDTHVAQCALDLDAELLTEDRVFVAIARHRPLRLATA